MNYFLMLLKCLYAMAIMIITLISSSYPLLSKNNFENLKFMHGALNSFSSGIFFTVSIMYTIPMADQQMRLYIGEGYSFPWSYLIVLISFSLILLLEKIILDHHSTKDHGTQIVQEKSGDVKQAMGLPVCETHDHYSMKKLPSPEQDKDRGNACQLDCDYRKSSQSEKEEAQKALISARPKVQFFFLIKFKRLEIFI